MKHMRAIELKTTEGRRPVLAAALLAGAVCAGCTVGPDFHRPDLPKTDSYTREPLAATQAAPVPGGEAQQFSPGAEVPSQWWSMFGSKTLDDLVEQAFKKNPTIDAANAALRVAQENTAAQYGMYFPTLQASYARSRHKDAVGTIAPTLSSNAPIYNLHTAQLNISYVPDVFGLNRRSVESLAAQEDVQKYQLDAAYLTLASNVVSAAIQEAALRAQIDAANKVIDISSHSLALVRRQAELGAASGLDVATQETQLTQAQQVLPPLMKQLNQTRDLLAVLVGKLPSEGGMENFNLDQMTLPRELPLSLPSKLADQRPDMRAAEAMVHAASAQVGVAVANRLPQFAITAAYGGTSTEFSRMFATGNKFWEIGGSIAQTIFDFGTLKHRQRAAEAALDQATAQYRSVALSAFQNMADSLYALDADARNFTAAAAAENSTKKLLDLTNRQLEAGAVNALALWSAESAYLQAKNTRIQAQAARYFDTVALFQALGGSWENHENPPSAKEN